MSHDAALIVKSIKGAGQTSVVEVSLTYNYQPAIAAAGLHSFSMLYGMSGEEAVNVLTKVHTYLTVHSGQCRELIRGGGEPGNGTGSLEDLLEDIETMIQASDEWPEGVWQVV